MMMTMMDNNGMDANMMHPGQHNSAENATTTNMMPGMDGFEAMQAIRQRAKFKSVPIIAVTAKAMKGDRQKCLEAGASDYITKPVDTEQLMSLLRIWLDK